MTWIPNLKFIIQNMIWIANLKFVNNVYYVLNNKLLDRYSSHDLNNKPFKEQTVLDHLNTELIPYSDPHCTSFFALQKASYIL